MVENGLGRFGDDVGRSRLGEQPAGKRSPKAGQPWSQNGLVSLIVFQMPENGPVKISGRPRPAVDAYRYGQGETRDENGAFYRNTREHFSIEK